jgi:formate hydrogenlyase transcriptional activator
MNANARTSLVPLSADRYETLLCVSQTIAAHRDSKELFRTIANHVREVVAFDFLSVVLYDEETQARTLRVIETPCYAGDTTPPLDMSPEQAVNWWVYRQQQAIVIPRLSEETRFPRFTEYLGTFGIQSMCAFPLTTVHRRLGTLGFGSVSPNAYSEDEVRFLSLVANQLALAVDDALHHESSQLAHQELQQRNERLKLVLDIGQSVASTLDLRQLCREISLPSPSRPS